MPIEEYKRRTGKQLTYTIEYDQGEYFIFREGVMKKSFPDAMVTGISPKDAKPDLMLRLAIGDIETLNGMDE